MRRLVLVSLLGLIVAGPSPSVVGSQTDLTGRTAGGAHYRIRVPDGWVPSDGLVIWNHGFSLDPVGPVDDLGPLSDLQTSQGYAVAASSYSLSGWALFRTRKDNENLVKTFRKRVGDPGMIYVTGQGMGGLVTAQLIEKGRVSGIVGGLSISGTLAGSQVLNEALDLRLMYDWICSGVPEAMIPGGANGLPEEIPAGFDVAEFARRVDACLGTDTAPKDRNPQQEFWLEFLRNLTGGSEYHVQHRLNYATFGLHDLVFDRNKQKGRRGLANRRAVYADPFINQNIARVGSGGKAGRLRKNYTPSGKVGDVKIVSIHTDKDGLVIVENQSEYAARVPGGNLTTGVVVEGDPSHAGFTEAETVAAWESLRGWVAGLPQPTVQDLQSTCDGLAAGGLADGPCRFDPAFDTPAYSGLREQ